MYDNSSQLYYTFAIRHATQRTHRSSRQSTDGYALDQRDQPFLTTMPQWVHAEGAQYREQVGGRLDIAYLNGWWHLYYAVSSGGSQHSCIGLAVN